MDSTKLVRTKQELFALPGYRTAVNPARDPLKKIRSHYYLGELVKCGLANCGTWHLDGFVVELENGGVTNIGNVCGKQFGDRFVTERDAYRERVLRPQLVAKVGAAKPRVLGLQNRIAALAARARTLIGRRKGLKDRFPKLAADLARRSHQGMHEILEEVERTDKEIEDLRAVNPSQSRESLRYQQVVRGRIAGLSFITAEAGQVVLDDLFQKSTAFLAIPMMNDVSTDSLIEWEGWIEHLDDRLASGERIVSDGESFFEEINLRQLAGVARNNAEASAIGKIKASDLEWIERPSGAATSQVDSLPRNRRERRLRDRITWQRPRR